MKRHGLFIFAFIFSLSIVFGSTPKANAAFNPNLLIDDIVFSDYNSMSVAQINAFLNRFPHSCISTDRGFSAKEPTGYSASTGYTYGGFVSAGQAIHSAAQAYELNSAVLLVTLEKEQSLVTGRNNFSGYCDNGDEHKYAAAVGYGCPDSGSSHVYTGVSLYRRNGIEHTNSGTTCVGRMVNGVFEPNPASVGFSQQVIRAAWLLKFGQQRALGKTDWAIIKGSWNNTDDLSTCYGGPMTPGTHKRCPTGSAIFYDGYTTIDGSPTRMTTGATAALYWYTPHFHGNQNFVSLFESWFGSTISSLYYACKKGVNPPTGPNGRKIVANKLGGRNDNLTLILPNYSSSGCIEAHTWNSSYQGWVGNTATNHPAVNPADNTVISADTNGDGKDELVFIKYRFTGSGRIEVHIWDPTYQHWANNIATNHPAVDPTDNAIIAADQNGDGKDELVFIKYRFTGSGRIEIHTWTDNLQGWVSNIATNHPGVDQVNSDVVAYDTNGDKRDELAYVKYRANASGRIEIHTWLPGQQAWYNNIATNHPAVDPANSDVVAYDTNGDGIDELAYIKYRFTGSGKMEVHTWLPGQQAWYNNIATNHPTL